MEDGNRGSGKWRTAGVPHRGWACEWIDDLGAPSDICEMCEISEIRYVHHMSHPDYPEILACGCICAGRMEENVAAAKRREAGAKSATQRRKRWPKLSGWHATERGNLAILKHGFRVTIFKKGSGWSGSLHNEATGKVIFAKRLYPDVESAQRGAFDGLEYLRQRTEQ